jgi:hypothetical protein
VLALRDGPSRFHARTHKHTRERYTARTRHTPERLSQTLSGVSVALDSHRAFVNHNCHRDAMHPRHVLPRRAHSTTPIDSILQGKLEHRPLNLDRSDATDDILSRFTSRQLPGTPKFIHLECSWADEWGGISNDKQQYATLKNARSARRPPPAKAVPPALGARQMCQKEPDNHHILRYVLAQSGEQQASRTEKRS